MNERRRLSGSGKCFVVWHFPSEDTSEYISTIPEHPGLVPEEPSTTSTASPMPSKYGSAAPITRTSTPKPYRDIKTPPPHPSSSSTFKQVKWLDSPIIRTPASRSETPFGHHEDSDAETATDVNKNTTTTASDTDINNVRNHTVTRHWHWQHHVLLDESLTASNNISNTLSHKDNDHDRSKTHSYQEDETRAITAEELEMDLEKYELERRRTRGVQRRLRAQTTYLPVTMTATSAATAAHEQGSSEYKREPPSLRRWSDAYRLASRFDKSMDNV